MKKHLFILPLLLLCSLSISAQSIKFSDLVDFTNLGKTDPRLRDALVAAQGQEEMRVLLTVRATDELFEAPPSASEFSTREDYRRALIERRKRELAQAIGDTVRSLVALGLRVTGQNILRIVVADGTAEQIGAALVLPGVERASLDRQLELIRPVAKPATVDN